MSIFTPTTWVPWIPWLGVVYISWDALSSVSKTSNKLIAAFVYLVIYLLASYWQGQVTDVVPEPYLDEIFHIPQAQAYCVGDFHVWDPKLTTPPGLYAFTTIFGNLGGIRNCTVYTLRHFNTLAFVATTLYVADCRALILRAWKQSPGVSDLSLSISHTALNIALLPPLIFFSGLFYTDVLSTCVVLRMYRLFLRKESSIWLYFAGILALTMRQTNIFWVAVFLGGLEVVRTIKSIDLVPLVEPSQPQAWRDKALFDFQSYSRGEIHDIPLNEAKIQDFALCGLSIAIAVLYHPILIIRNLWPYIALLLSFAGFIFWNGGVVLGDKSNHVATIHLPQLFYLSSFLAFFSFPLLLPSLYSLLKPYLSILIPSLRSTPNPSNPPTRNPFITGLFIVISSIAVLAIIHFNTIIHPFTLADNRHYVFYIFRYTILFHPLIRYLLAPIYMLFIYLIYQTLSSPFPPPSNSAHKLQANPAGAQRIRENTQPSFPTGPTTSFVLIYFLSTALSLITAPLVEPRYFIIPWVVWRLHVPPLSFASASVSRSSSGKRAGRKRGWGWSDLMKGYDWRLIIETFWFLGINAVTGYVFLYKGFEWKQEPGMVQRFMW